MSRGCLRRHQHAFTDGHHTRGWNGPTRRMCAFCAQLAAIAFSAAKLSRSATPPSATTTERAGTNARKRIATAPRQTISEESGEGKEGVRTGRSRLSLYHHKNKTSNNAKHKS